MKFSPHCVALSTHAQIWIGNVLLLFFATCTPLHDSALDPQHPLSQAVPRVMAREVNREV